MNLLFGKNFTPAFVELADNSTATITAITYRLGPVTHPGTNPFADVLASLQRAARRGVHVSVFFCPWGIPITQRRAQASLETRLSSDRVKLHHAAYNTRLHAKLYSFDESALIIGSHNLTYSSLMSHAELSIRLHITQLPPDIYKWLDALTQPCNVQAH